MLGLAVAVWAVVALLDPFAGGGDRVRVVIPQGAGVSRIAELLDERGVIASAAVFEARVRVSGAGEDLKPGTYTLREGLGYGGAIDALSAGPSRRFIQLTLTEGRSRRELAGPVRRAGVRGSYTRASARTRALDLSRYGAQGARSLEGFLFPSTYELRRGATARQLVRTQLDAFRREFAKVDLRAARRRNLTPYDVLIVASMVEREAQLDRERPLVASVIYNRLRNGQPLAIDATVRFAVNNWSRPLRRSQLAVDSPYNTYTNAGLPPGPIGNPGLASMQAAARPARSSFLFYVVKPNTCGEHSFSRTMQQFERDRARYEAERARRGGRSPDTCPE